MTESYHVHNARMVQAEHWGDTQTLLRFKGVSCGHGYGANEATIFMDKSALKKMIGIVQLGESDSVPKEPPCRQCERWAPDYFLGGVICCTKTSKMRGDFSCYRPKEGTE